ncbi:MAG: exodeoxyribonuclease VII small subunit [Rhodobacteraceae bacterium]|nr:exodeoxyribonuclease VII small subunit [Paracoccaceae bacterium]
MSDTRAEEMSFEDALKKLEEIVTKLESAEVSLEQSIDLYEEGARLRAHCEARLNAAQERVEAIRLAQSGEPAGTEPFDPA